MEPNESRLPAIPDGRSPADLTKKELVAHLVAVEAIPQWKLNVMTRDAIVALFALPRDEALAAVDAAGLEHGRKHRRGRIGVDVAAEGDDETAVYEYLLTGRVRR
ncbi:MAG: hypothetical protein IPM39_15015 [Chloroflexi bacterium]|nr:hypothetical protein [Chloroflexota bacterium]